ncbi:MAG: site-2 protease family protein [Planctomycetota bacterium]|jgi:regulator of sigma E protease
MVMEILALSLAEFWSQWLWPIILLVVGLGLVIFVHELGHFLLAKLVRIKVERFALGFGPRLAGFKVGETEYRVNLLPLGGYLKMLGQEDFRPLEERSTLDPRSFMAKSVGARALVISGGVVMNVILAAVLFVIIGMVGKEFAAPVIGGTVEGMPAASARVNWHKPPAGEAQWPEDMPDERLAAGDRAVRMEGDSAVLWVINNEVTNFTDVAMTAILASPDDKFKFTIERDHNGRTWRGTADIGVKDDDGRLAFGLKVPVDTVVGEPENLITASAFQPKDRIVEAAGRKIEHLWEIEEIDKGLGGRPVTVVVERRGRRLNLQLTPQLEIAEGVHRLKDGTILRGRIQDWQDKEIERPRGQGEAGKLKVREYEILLEDGSRRKFLNVDEDPTPIPRILGMMPRMKILALIEGKPAHEAGLRPGDIILDYGDVRLPSHRQLLELNEKFLGKETSITVLRGGKRQQFTISPREREQEALIGVHVVADQANPVVGYVDQGSPAQNAGIASGSRITAVNGIKVKSWGDIHLLLKKFMGKKVSLTYRLGSQSGLAEIPRLDETIFNPADCTFRLLAEDVLFEPLTVRIAKPGAWSALKWGCREAFKSVLSTYVSLRSIIRGYASTKAVSGPLGIGVMAISVGRRSFVDFVYFIGFISAVLAVFNFLPFPVVDGGHAVFLLIEKIRGKPVPLKVMNIVQMIGLAMLIVVFVLVTWQDVSKVLRRLW